MKTSTKRILSIGSAGLLFIGILVVYTALIRPELSEVAQKRALLVSKQTLFTNQKNAVSQVQALIGRFQSLAKLQETVSLALPQQENVTQVLNQIQSIANLSKVELGTFSIRPLAFEAAKQPLIRRLGSLEISLTLTGPYENLKQFLKSLETNVRVINVRELHLVPAPTPQIENFSLTLTVETFYQE